MPAVIAFEPQRIPIPMAAVLSNHAAQTVDRFRIMRLLGRGAQGNVHLAYDPKLDRQVAIKTLDGAAASDPQHAAALIAAARTASSLSHPNIVPVFEVGIHAGQPFVVFEFVEGRPLSALLASDGALAMGRAVVLMSQILAGMTQVHASGLLHGDIKPANILISANGIPRVTDFGISRRALAAEGETVHSGTVQYMAPECFGEEGIDYRADVFALGLVFHEMLTGTAVYAADNEYAQIFRILNESPPAPSTCNPRIDRRIDEIVMKALHRDKQARYADAAAMKRELDRYRVPSGNTAQAELKEQTVHSTVEFLLRRMALKSDFPALSASFSRINQLAGNASDTPIKTIADLVIRDFALTQKLLRVVNSAAFGAGKITNVSQAITLLGISQLRALATGMMLANGGKPATQQPAVAALLTDAFIAGVIARNIGRMIGLAQVEELFICGMFSRLGELLTLYYLNDEHSAIALRMQTEGVNSELASRAVLGLPFEQLGAEVARHWNFPESIINALRPLPEGELAASASSDARMWHCAGYTRELCALARATPPGEIEDAFRAHLARHAPTVPVEAARVRQLIGYSVEAALKYVAASGLSAAGTGLIAGLTALHMATVDPIAEPIACTTAAQTRSDTHGQSGDAPAEKASLAPVMPAPMTRPRLGARLALAWKALF